MIETVGNLIEEVVLEKNEVIETHAEGEPNLQITQIIKGVSLMSKRGLNLALRLQ